MENTIIDQRYALLADIGAGGEAHVFRALDNTTGNDVAVRLAYRHSTRSATGEPASHHDFWVSLLAEGTDSKFGTYQVFELLEGRTLGQLIPSGPLDAESWRLFVEQSLDAVGALHDAGWVHGDLNADNFFLTEKCWKVLELPFHLIDPPEKRSALFGSIHTLAPEQIDGGRPTVLSDIYSLGCLYYYAASGDYPHTGANSKEVAIHCLLYPPDPLEEKAAHLPPGWCAWVMNLLARDPAQRTQTVAAARQALGVPVA